MIRNWPSFVTFVACPGSVMNGVVGVWVAGSGGCGGSVATVAFSFVMNALQ